MSAFTHFSAFSRLNDTHRYQLDAPLCWDIGAKGSGWQFTIPKGTVFDITIPWFVRWAISPHDTRILPAAAVHDELLKQNFGPAFASAEFFRAAKARGCNTLWSWTLFISTLIWTASGGHDHGQRFTT